MKDLEPANGHALTAAPLPDTSGKAAQGSAKSGGSLDDPRLHAAMEEYLTLLQQGQRPDRDAFLARYPQVAPALAACLQGLDFVHAAGPELSHPTVPARLSRERGPEDDVVAPAGPLGDFRIIREVGRGGMGVVYEAEQVSLGRRVALKVLPFAATMDPRQLQRFHNEVRAAASLDHPHIVHVHAVGCERAVHFYAMQFIEGQTLAGMIADLRQANGWPVAADAQPTTPQIPEAPAPDTVPRAAASTERAPRDRAYFRRVAELGIQAAEALDHAHTLGIVHRDIKPANLLVGGEPRESATGVNLWVTDFGLAHIQSDARLTMTGDLVGTLRYMSPEQALAKRVVVDHRTDVYSLGATLYELLTLEPVFSGNDRQELLRQIAFEEPKAPGRINKAIPPELETIVQKAMEKNPADRYATAKELAEDLRRFLADEPIRARPAGVVRRLRKWGRRHPAMVAAVAAALTVALAVLAGGIGWVANDRATRAQNTADEIKAALKESADWQQRGRVPEALAAARRAQAALAGGHADAALRQSVKARVRDLHLLARLEEARLEGSKVKDGHFDYEPADRRYSEIFCQFNLDVEAGSVDEAGARLRDSAVALELASFLDDWAALLRVNRQPEARWKRLLAVAGHVDPDGWRCQLRRALAGRDRKLLVSLASGDKVAHLLPWTSSALANALQMAGAAQPAEALLRKAQQQHPADFWINEILGLDLCLSKPPRPEEAIPFLMVAVALRPQSPGAHTNLGNALHDKKDWNGAIAEHKEAIRLKRDYAEAHYNLGYALYEKKDLHGAIGEFREAIRLKSDYADAHNNLGNALDDKGDGDGAIGEFREAIRLKKNYPEAHTNLGNALRDKGRLDEAIAAFREAIRLKKDFPDAHSNLGAALRDKGRLDEAIAECREAIRLKKDFPDAHNNLGAALCDKGRLDEAIAAFREAIRLKKDDPIAHNNLGAALRDKGRLDEAVAEYREAIRLKKDFAEAHTGLGNALRDKGQVDEAIAACREAIRLKKDFPDAHSNLGAALRDKGRLDEAIAECREAIRLKKDFPDAYNNLGAALCDKGRLDEAIAACREAIRLKNDYPEAHCNLGFPLQGKGQFKEAVQELRRGHQLGLRAPSWRYPSAQWLAHAEQLARFDERLSAVLDGKDHPKDAGERIFFAELCTGYRKRPAAAVRFYRDAFADKPQLAEALVTANRYNAACAAALAGCGQGKDAAGLDETERSRLRRQALDWLQADLQACQRLLKKEPAKGGPTAGQQLQHWLQDPDFNGVRGPDALGKLPKAERQAWRKLWADVGDMLARSQGKATPQKKSDAK